MTGAMDDLPDTLPPPADTEPPEPTIRDLYEVQQTTVLKLSELEIAVKSVPEAMRALGTLVVEHYQREAKRNDEQDRRLDDLERHLRAAEKRIVDIEAKIA